ncbi:hypothetical protein CBS101457_003747 [Exobasidium rhododendri]|nr:hypothetical protein CBS101457_003747 [Exobasidium rhododendri]
MQGTNGDTLEKMRGRSGAAHRYLAVIAPPESHRGEGNDIGTIPVAVIENSPAPQRSVRFAEGPGEVLESTLMSNEWRQVKVEEDVERTDLGREIERVEKDGEFSDQAHLLGRSSQQNFIFQPPDDAMFAELRAFLDQEDAASSSSSSDEEEEQSRFTEEFYEQRRLKKLRANEAILSKLGLGAQKTSSPMEDLGAEEGEEASRPSHISMKRKGGATKANKWQRTQLRVDADETTTSLPLPGCTTEVAYVDVPALRDRVRLQHVYFDDVEILPPGTAVEETLMESEGEEGIEVLLETRKRRKTKKFDDFEAEPNPIKRKKEKMKPLPIRRGTAGEAMEGGGTTCHQCRRKTDDEKMRCRFHENGKVCPLYWCKRCLGVRYAIEWDAESRTFQCPRCSAYCNCSICLRKAGLTRFVPESVNTGLAKLLQDEKGNRIYASVKHYIEAKVGRSVKIGPGGLSQRSSKSKKEAREREASASRQERKQKVASVKKGKKDHRTGGERDMQGGGGKSKKIKLTWQRKAQQSALGTYGAAKKRKEKVFPIKKKTGSALLRAGKERGAGKARTPLRSVDGDNVWVRSKADALATSSSDSEVSTLTALSDYSSGEEQDGEGRRLDYDKEDNIRDTDFDTINTTEDGDLEESTDVHPSSPVAGQVEYFMHHPLQNTAEQYSSTTLDSQFTHHSSDSFPIGIDPLVDPFPLHSSQDMATIMNQLREAGYV